MMHFLPVLLAATAAAAPTILLEPSTQLIEERATSSPIPINIAFGVTIPTASSTSSPPYIVINGYQFVFPAVTTSGTLVSFLGNFAGSHGYNTQLTSINPSAPQNVTSSTTTTSSTSQSGGPSQSNATALAESARIVATSFSSGNASSAAAAGSGTGNTGTSTSSSGASNSTAVATSNAVGGVNITTAANTFSASDAQSVQNARAADAATSCAADSGTGAEAEADAITTVLIPVGQTPDGRQISVVSSAWAACAAGINAPTTMSTGSSSSGSQASLTGVSSTVTCNGITSTRQTTQTVFRVQVVGTYTKGSGFTGAIAGQRVAESMVSC